MTCHPQFGVALTRSRLRVEVAGPLRPSGTSNGAASELSGISRMRHFGHKIAPKTRVATDPVTSRGIDAPDRRSDAVDDRSVLLGGAVRAELRLMLAPVLMDLS